MMEPQGAAWRRHQGGSALIVSLILLVVLTLIVISAIKSTNVNSKIVGNLQTFREGEAAAQQAIEGVINSPFQTAPVASTRSIDIDHDGTNNYNVTVPAPKCLNVTPIKVTELDIGNADDVPCFASSTNPVPGVAGGNSLCANTQWEIKATSAVAAAGTATVTTHQGISVRVATGTSCP